MFFILEMMILEQKGNKDFHTFALFQQIIRVRSTLEKHWNLPGGMVKWPLSKGWIPHAVRFRPTDGDFHDLVEPVHW